jgi:hypothetical protein
MYVLSANAKKSSKERASTMLRYCSFCGLFLGEKEPYENKEVTHGICSPCLKEKTKEPEQEVYETLERRTASQHAPRSRTVEERMGRRNG